MNFGAQLRRQGSQIALNVMWSFSGFLDLSEFISDFDFQLGIKKNERAEVEEGAENDQKFTKFEMSIVS